MSETPHVCQIVSTFNPVIGGVQRVTENMCRSLVEEGDNVIVLTRRLPGLPPFEMIAGIPVYRPGYPSAGKLGALTFALHTLWLLATRFRRFRILHVQNIDTPLLVGLIARVFLRRRLVATIHGEEKLFAKEQTWIGRIRLNLMFRLVDVFGALSPPMEEELHANGISPSRVRFIPNGVDTTTYRPPSDAERRDARRRLNVADDEVVVLYLGRLVALKRIDMLLNAWQQLTPSQPCRLLIVGDGPERERLTRCARELNLTYVRFDAATSDVPSYLHAADVFVLPSQEEGLSLALLEAMAAGVTVIVTALPGNQTVVQHGKTGLVVPVNDLGALVTRLGEAIRSPELRQELGTTARQRICSHYSLDRFAESHRTLYRDVIEGIN